MKPVVVLLGLVVLLDAAFAAEESCVGRCGSFNPEKKCQCDTMCLYYGSCCEDFATICPRKIARGDTFDEAAEWTTTASGGLIAGQTPTSDTVAATVPAPAPPTPGPTTSTDPNAAACSGQPFDAFLQLKNGSIYAFRGDYFFELDDKSVLPGYPKLIQDVWGIPGPIDAAFTRVNCQGKSYIFKGNQYWRFEGDVLDEDYPRSISVGFDGVPDGVEAAFAVPAPSHLGKEKAYFFKGDMYYQYEFKHQPTHEECVEMSKSSPSVLFERYTDLYCDQTWEELFSELFGGSSSTLPSGPRYTRRDWQGITPPLDAAIVGRVQTTKPTSPPPARRTAGRRRRPSKKRGRGRHARYVFLEDLWGDFFDYDYSQIAEESTMEEPKSSPVQNVYFFKKDKYYRVDLQTKRVSNVNPPYPRSIAKYWLGCKQEERPDTSKAEKK